MGRPYVGKPRRYVRTINGHPYIYERTERPIRSLSKSDMASSSILESLVPKRTPANTFYYAKKVGQYGYMVEVAEKYLRPVTPFEAQNPDVLKSILQGVVA